MQMKEMSIIKGKNGGIDVVSIRNPDTDRRWFLGTNYTKEGLMKALKQFIVNQKQILGV